MMNLLILLNNIFVMTILLKIKVKEDQNFQNKILKIIKKNKILKIK